MSALVFTYLALRPIKRVPQDSQRSKRPGYSPPGPASPGCWTASRRMRV